jgi:cysteine protease ATG4
MITADETKMVEHEICIPVNTHKIKQSVFGGDEADGQELQEQLTNTSKRSTPAEYDICQEHGYKYEYGLQEDEDDGTSYLPSDNVDATQSELPLDGNKQFFVTKSQERIPFVYLLGKTFHPVYGYQSRKEFEASLYWFSYRWDFPEIKPYGITSDAGWGCMLRSAQMLLAHCLRVHFKPQNWKPPTSNAKCRDDPFITSLLNWFADFPSTKESIYSLHNMVAAGLMKYETLPGEWYGPGTACYVLKDLVSLHQQIQPSLFRVHIASEGGTIYRDTVRSLMTRDSKLRAEEREKRKEKTKVIPLHPLDPSAPPPPLPKDEKLDWDTALLLLIPLRLGLDKFNEDYSEILARSFWLPQSVGILGGRPRGARWFFGAYADGTKILGLDPHTIQAAPQRKSLHAPAGNHINEMVVDLSDEYMQSVHTQNPEVFPISRMDPSVALGFYCTDRNDFVELEAGLKRLKSKTSSPDLFAFADRAPDYSLSSAFNSMVMADLEDGMNTDITEDSDDDEYVLL